VQNKILYCSEWNTSQTSLRYSIEAAVASRAAAVAMATPKQGEEEFLKTVFSV